MNLIHMVDDLNEWIECFIVVLDECADDAIDAIRRAHDEFYADDARIAYGDVLDDAMDECGFDYAIFRDRPMGYKIDELVVNWNED